MPGISAAPQTSVERGRAAPGVRLAPFVPSPQPMVDRMLALAHTGPGDTVYDLGSGNGQIVITAARQFGARATGIEIDEDLVRLSSARIAEGGLGSRARIIHGDFLGADLRAATIVTLYQLPAVNELLRPLLETQLRPGARVVSLDFPVSTWKPVRVETATLPDGSQHAIYVYSVGQTREVTVAQQDKRAYAATRFAVEVGGVIVGFVQSVEGGNASAEVVTEKLGLDGIRHKHISGVKYEDVAVTSGIGMSKVFYSWIADTLRGTFTRQNGAIVGVDYSFSEASRLAFYQTLISEVAFPALDGNSKDAAFLTVKMAPEYTRRQAGTGGQVDSGSGSGSVKGQAHKQWLRSNFRLAIDGLDCDSVSKIDAITVRQSVVEQPIGELRDYEHEPGYLEISDVAVELPEAHAESFYAWFDDFVVKGNSGANAEKNGTLQYLGTNGDVLFTLTFHSLGIFKLKPLRIESGSESVRRVRAEMYCEAISFNFGSGAVSEFKGNTPEDKGTTDGNDKDLQSISSSSSRRGVLEDKDAAARALTPLRAAPIDAPERLVATARGPGLRFRS